MNKKTKRAFGRTSCTYSIDITLLDSTERIEGTVQNDGYGGMCFETETYLEPGADILIHLKKGGRASKTLKEKPGFRGVVAWCREAEEGAYGVGVRFMEDVCTYCGCEIPYTKIHKTDDHKYLCPQCSAHLKGMKAGAVLTRLERYLNGNVL